MVKTADDRVDNALDIAVVHEVAARRIDFAGHDLLNEAETAFQNAIHSNATYARAHIGLGSANYVRLQRAASISATIDSPEMQTMLAEYDQGVQLAHAADDLADRFACLPFGVGPRVCIGAHFALVEATLALARLVGAFRFALIDKKPVMAMGVVTTQPDYSPMFSITPRS